MARSFALKLVSDYSISLEIAIVSVPYHFGNPALKMVYHKIFNSCHQQCPNALISPRIDYLKFIEVEDWILREIQVIPFELKHREGNQVCIMIDNQVQRLWVEEVTVVRMGGQRG